MHVVARCWSDYTSEKYSLARTQISVQGAILVARAANPKLKLLQLSQQPIPLEEIRRTIWNAKKAALADRQYGHLDAAAIGVFLEREKQLEVLDVSQNPLTGPAHNLFHGVGTLFQGLQRCTKLRELQYVRVCLIGR